MESSPAGGGAPLNRTMTQAGGKAISRFFIKFPEGEMPKANHILTIKLTASEARAVYRATKAMGDIALDSLSGWRKRMGAIRPPTLEHAERKLKAVLDRCEEGTFVGGI